MCIATASGFVRPETRQAGGDDDIFIPPNEMNGAMQGDQVWSNSRRPGPTAGIADASSRILSRRNPTVVGIFHYALQEHAPGNTVTPLDEPDHQPILIPFGLEQAPALPTELRIASLVRHRRATSFVTSDLEGMVVDVEITDWPTPTRSARGRVIEILGRERTIRCGRRNRHPQASSPHVFPPNVLDEARAIAHWIGGLPAA